MSDPGNARARRNAQLRAEAHRSDWTSFPARLRDWMARIQSIEASNPHTPGVVQAALGVEAALSAAEQYRVSDRRKRKLRSEIVKQELLMKLEEIRSQVEREAQRLQSLGEEIAEKREEIEMLCLRITALREERDQLKRADKPAASG